MKATKWRFARSLSGPRFSRLPILSAAIALAQCSALPITNGNQPAPPPNYAAIIASNIRDTKGFASDSDFQISGLRWVHSAIGWNWLACVRFRDRGHLRFYAFFLDESSVVSSRYDVRTDQCAMQQYTPLDLPTGYISAPGTEQQPLTGAPSGPFPLQQGIY